MPVVLWSTSAFLFAVGATPPLKPLGSMPHRHPPCAAQFAAGSAARFPDAELSPQVLGHSRTQMTKGLKDQRSVPQIFPFQKCLGCPSTTPLFGGPWFQDANLLSLGRNLHLQTQSKPTCKVPPQTSWVLHFACLLSQVQPHRPALSVTLHLTDTEWDQKDRRRTPVPPPPQSHS